MKEVNKEPGRARLARRMVTFLAALSALTIGLFYASYSGIHVKAADHRDSPTADANPEGDITDVFAFVDPNDATQLVLIMNVNPFSVPAELPTYSFSNEFLYQFKFANHNDANADLVIQAKFSSVPVSQCQSGQLVKIYGPTSPEQQGIQNTIVSQALTAEGCTNGTFAQNGIRSSPVNGMIPSLQTWDSSSESALGSRMCIAPSPARHWALCVEDKCAPTARVALTVSADSMFLRLPSSFRRIWYAGLVSSETSSCSGSGAP